MHRRTFPEALARGTVFSSPTLFPRSIPAAEPKIQTPAPTGMKIAAVEPIMIQGARGYHAWNLVKVKSDQGIEGIGEGFAFSCPVRIHSSDRRHVDDQSNPISPEKCLAWHLDGDVLQRRVSGALCFSRVAVPSKNLIGRLYGHTRCGQSPNVFAKFDG